jgi:transposase
MRDLVVGTTRAKQMRGFGGCGARIGSPAAYSVTSIWKPGCRRITRYGRFGQSVDDALNALSGEFEALYSHLGRPSIPPERLLRALLLQAFYSVRSERLLMEQLDYNLLFRWFVGLGIDDPVWHPTAFTTNCDRLLQGEVAAKFLAAVLSHARVRQLLSRERFSVDRTLIEAWASMKSFRPKDGVDEPPGGGRNASRNFHGEQRRNHTHASTTDGEARLFRKAPARRPSSASWAICSWRTARAWSSRRG